jgi:hypothetical protein
MGHVGREGGRERGAREREKKVGPNSAEPGGFSFFFFLFIISISIYVISFFF